MVRPSPAPFHVLADLHGDPMVELTFYPPDELLYLRWHGHLTAEEVIRGVKLVREQQVKIGRPFRRVLNDKSAASGEWHEALPWLQYEWLPVAKAAGLQALSYVFSPDLAQQLVTQEFVAKVRPFLAIELFHNLEEAWQWLLAQPAANEQGR